MFIVFEGIDGTGKSTQVKMLVEALEQSGQEVIASREPTDGPHGRRLRESAATGRLSPEDELDLFHQDRRDHVEQLIKPAIARGAVVILDRYYFSTIAYQGIRGFDPKKIRETNEAFAPRPDHVFLLQIPTELALERIGVRDGQANEFEKREFLEQCHQIFDSLEDPFIHRIDASGSPDEVHTAIMSHLSEIA